MVKPPDSLSNAMTYARTDVMVLTKAVAQKQDVTVAKYART